LLLPSIGLILGSSVLNVRKMAALVYARFSNASAIVDLLSIGQEDLKANDVHGRLLAVKYPFFCSH